MELALSEIHSLTAFGLVEKASMTCPTFRPPSLFNRAIEILLVNRTDEALLVNRTSESQASQGEKTVCGEELHIECMIFCEGV